MHVAGAFMFRMLFQVGEDREFLFEWPLKLDIFSKKLQSF